ncbi:MAG: AtpZ/AtpI family protein [Armatimonadota bacterium]
MTMRKDEDPKNQTQETTEEEADELLAQFPDPETDERLQAPRASDLPPVPEVQFKRPDTQTARGYKPRPKRSGVSGAGSPSGGIGDDEAGEYRNMGIASTIGFSLVGSIIAGTVLGLLVDRYLLHSTTTPWGLIIGFLAGVLSGFISLVRVTNRLNK